MVVTEENFSEGGRGASQFAVALLTKAPAMEMLIDRLRSVASVREHYLSYDISMCIM